MHRTDIEYLEIVRVLHDYAPTEQGCLSLRKGDLIYVQTKADNGWWMGVCKQDTGGELEADLQEPKWKL